MAIAAMILFASFMVLVGLVRVVIQWRRTGDTGFRRLHGRVGPVQQWVDGLTASGPLAVGVIGPVAALAGLEPVALLDSPLVQAFGLALMVLGAVATFAAQLAMGASWRIGVDPGERTLLVTSGVFRLVRNPIYTALIIAFVGLTLMVPNVITFAGLCAVVVGIQIQVRMEEEPHLLRVHGEAYRHYAATVGRFLPGIGRLGRLPSRKP